MKKILCLLGFHDDESEQETVFKTKSVETSNHRFVCKRCNRKTEWTGGTTFGPIEFNITK